MSRKHWIDEFFRRRLEQGTFAVEKGELEDVHALLVKRNGSGSLIRGGRFSKWWLTALIPAAGVLWWASSDGGRGAELPEALVTEQRASNNATVTDHGVPSTTDSLDEATIHAGDTQPRAEASETEMNTTAERTSGTARADEIGNAENRERQLAPRSADAPRSAAMKGIGGSDKGRSSQGRAGERRALQSEATPQRESKRATAAGRNGSRAGSDRASRSEQAGRSGANVDVQGRSAGDPASEVRPALTAKDVGAGDQAGTLRSDQQDQVTLKLHADDQDGTRPDVVGERPASQDNVPAQAQLPPMAPSPMDPDAPSDLGLVATKAAQAENLLSDSEGLASARDQRAAVDFMDLRWSMPAPLEAPQPVQPQLTPFKLMASGELHAFGAPLTVRARSGGQRSEAQNGLLLGLEYRVRTKRFSWATGIHYGRYVLKADQGVTDVSLTFVELPLLASLKFGRGRFGLLAQGGISLDLLFNSTGQYPVTGDRTSAGFPEEAFQAMNVSWSLRPQALYHADERFSVAVGPLWKAQLGSVANNGPLEGAHITASGLSFGVNWRLDGSTY